MPLNNRGRYRFVQKLTLTLSIISFQISLYAQDANVGINQATTLVKSYFPTALNLLYAIGGVVGIIGAVKVYNKWSHGEQDTGKVAASWFGACVFLVVVASVLKAFFNL